MYLYFKTKFLQLINWQSLDEVYLFEILFFDEILKFLSKDFSKSYTYEEIKQGVPYISLEIQASSLEQIAKEVFSEKQKYALGVLVEDGYVHKKDELYNISLKGLSAITSGGIMGKEKRELIRFNYQNIIWFIGVIFLVLNFIVRIKK